MSSSLLFKKTDADAHVSTDNNLSGGAFPDRPAPQFPLEMGRTKTVSMATAFLPLQVDEDGAVRYDALARVGRSAEATVHSQYRDLVPMDIPHNAAEQWAKPSEEITSSSITAKTRAAIDKIVAMRTGALRTTAATAAATARAIPPRFIRYTPAPNNVSKRPSVDPETGLAALEISEREDNSTKAPSSRVIRVASVPVDPIEPPRFGFRRIPPPPGSPPAPVMHSPPRKLTKADRDEWNIPPCISNWKNAKGYTIPLDKRLAADGRGLQEHTINDNFAMFSEALMIAERHAREEVRQRAAMQQRIALKEKEFKEESLRQLAAEAREERRGFVSRTVSATVSHNRHLDHSSNANKNSKEEYRRDEHSSIRHKSRERNDESEEGYICSNENEEIERQKRDEIRRDKSRQLQREYRMSHMGVDAKSRHAKTMAERDISEKIALGVSKPTLSKDTMFDARLFNQSEGFSNGFSNEEAYNIYDKPLFSEPGKIYRGIQKTEGSAVPERTGPVEFERGNTYNSSSSSANNSQGHDYSSSSSSSSSVNAGDKRRK